MRRVRSVRRRCCLSTRPGDYNCLHRDLYGEHVFPMQIAILLDQPGEDFKGGEFVMTEQRPRMQTRAMVLPLRRGDAAVFAVNSRPMKGTRGDYQVKLNHGVEQALLGQAAHRRCDLPRCDLACFRLGWMMCRTACPVSIWDRMPLFCAALRAGVRLSWLL